VFESEGLGSGPSVEVSTLCGAAGHSGVGVDGDSKAARFHHPTAVLFDATGNLIVSDSAAHCIRHVSVKGEVTVLAGTPGKSGFADGKGREALFDRPDQLCLDLQGRILCCDRNNHRIRMITENGIVCSSFSLPLIPAHPSFSLSL
jgi:hypothetical protein